MQVIGYDIASTLRRERVRRTLRQITPHWQKSFFVLDSSPDAALALYAQLVECVDQAEDGLVMAEALPPPPGQGLPRAFSDAGTGIFLLG